MHTTTPNQISQIMAKKKTTQDYIEELKDSIRQKTDKGFDPWLMPILRSTAMNMVILDRIQEQLENDNMVDIMDGSMGQQKLNVHPLLDKYDKMQNTLVRQFEALGLTNKGKAGGGGGSDESDVDLVLSALTNK
jgi:hypothetical protein